MTSYNEKPFRQWKTSALCTQVLFADSCEKTTRKNEKMGV